MTREEAIEFGNMWLQINEDCKDSSTYTFFQMAIKVLEQEPRCKDCKWWKDSDGIYRRGCRAESHCPINRREVYEGNGYCYLFSPKADMKEVENENN